MTKVAIYARVSTDQQAERQTIQQQLDACREFCASKGYEVAEVFKDDGVSGALPLEERPEGKRLLATEGYSKVIVYCVDRLARSQVEGSLAWKMLEQRGTPLEFVTQSFDGTPEGTFTFQVMVAVAELERALIARRMKVGREKAAKTLHKYVGGPTAFGIDVKDGYLVVNEAEAAIVRRIFNDYVAGATQRQIARQLVAEGIPTKNGSGPWNQLRISDVLKNETYLGRAYTGRTKVVPKTEDELKRGRERAKQEGRDPDKVSKTKQVAVEDESQWIEIRCPRLISDELWKAARARAERNLQDSHRRGPKENPFLLTSVLRCEPCGGAMIGQTKSTICNNRRYTYRYYYCCRAHKYLTGCRTPEVVRAEAIDDKVWAALVEAFSDPQDVLTACRVHRAEAAKDVANESGRVAALRGKLEKSEEERQRVISWCRQGRISEQDLDRQLEELKEKVSGMQAELDQLEQEAQQRVAVEQIEASVHATIKRIKEADAGSLKKRQELVGILIPTVWLDADNNIKIECIVPGLIELDSATATGIASTKVKRKTSG